MSDDEPRSIVVDSGQCWTASSLALALYHARKFREPLDKLRAVAAQLWALPDLYFKAEVMQAVRDAPRGYCPTCGVGFVEYVGCPRDDCDWINDPEKSPTFVWNHPNVTITNGWDTGAPEVPPAVNEWRTS